MASVRPPRIIRGFFPGTQWKLKTTGNVLYLTFDDGPTPTVTPWVLNTLKKFHAKATFFCLGKNVERYPEIFENIKYFGHKVGNHTYSHLNGWKTNNREYINDIELAAGLVQSQLFRPPYGMITPFQLRELKKNYKIIMWDVLSHDYDVDVTPVKCLENVLENARSGSIVVFHDSVKASANLYYALPRVLEFFTQKGFKFRAIK